MKSPPTTLDCSGTLDARRLEVCLRAATAGHGDQRRSPVVDLSSLSFVDPAGLVGLALCVEHLRQRGPKPVVHYPADDSVGHYLLRMGLRNVLRGRARNQRAPRGRPRQRISSALLELSIIEDTADVDKLLSRLTDRVGRILKAELHYLPADVHNFASVISELCRNIVDHSGSVGFVAAQRYTRGDHDRFAVISVGDLGVGLRATLGTRYPVDQWSDTEVLRKSLLPEYSRHPDRGMGLTFVEKVASDYRGSLRLRSGSSCIYIRGNRLLSIPGAPFPGTQATISLRERAR
jgi:anti-anti-sigma regulatory factor